MPIIPKGKIMYRYVNPKAIENKKLCKRIELAAKRVYERIKSIDLKQIGISEYNQRYLGQTLAYPESIFQRYSYLLSLAISDDITPIEDFVLVDYGGGSGLLSLLACESGFGTVIYNDIYDVSCNDIQKLSKAIDVQIKDFVCGDIDELITYLKAHSVNINAVVSYDVIEHIYDVEGYLQKLRLLSNSSYRIVMGSGANIKNPSYRRIAMKGHLECEYEDRKKEWGHKERDSLKSYFDVRKQIISRYDSKIEGKEVERLAKRTRGLIQHDIEKCVDEYKKTGNISYRPKHPTNTCDPYTGNWAENLMETEWLESILRESSCNVKILSGFWETTGPTVTRHINKIKNKIIKHLGSKALCLSPYYVVCANYCADGTFN